MGKKLALAVLLSMLLLLSASVGYAAVAQINVTILTANQSEFNTTTPQINVSCMDSSSPTNTSTFNVTVFNSSAVKDGPNLGSTFAANTTQVDANSSVLITLNAMPSPSVQRYAVRCFNSSVAAAGGAGASAVNDSAFSFKINARPSISAVEPTSGYIAKNTPVTFTVSWTDTNSTNVNGTNLEADSVKIFVCSDNRFEPDSLSCNKADTQYCSSSLETDNTTSCDYTIAFTDSAGDNSAYVWAVDDNNFPSSAGTKVTWFTAGTFTEEQAAEQQTFIQTQAAEQAAAAARAAAAAQGGGGGGVPREIGGVPTAVLVIVVVVVLVLGWLIFKGNPFKQN